MMRMLLTGCIVVGLVILAGVAPVLASDALEYFRAGYEAGMEREWDQAIEQYSRALEIDPKYGDAYFQRAITFQMAGRPLEAIADFESCLKLEPRKYLAMEYLAKLYMEHGEYRKALELYERALPLVKNPKWRSIVKYWIAGAKKKLKAAAKSARRTNKRGRKPLY
jgi:tetratricopeptide (TPR) repeat protein